MNVVQKNVCKSMFLSTIGHTCDQQVRTVLNKNSNDGFVEKENRGGARKVDTHLNTRENIKEHINLYPRVESHYVRQDSRCQYIHPGLNIRKMYEMYKEWCLNRNQQCASISSYKTVFYGLNIKFFKPKKDLCDLCATANPAFREEENEEMQAIRLAAKGKWTDHIAQKDYVRKLKKQDKESAIHNKERATAVFDLMQVVYLPISDQSSVFYKRRLSCYCFTVFDLGTNQGYCFNWNETEAQRGSNEIASGVFMFLRELEKSSPDTREVSLYADGCAGQNKNSIFPSMLFHFLGLSEKIETITVTYFVPGHGESEGDAMHSTIEGAIKRAGNIALPQQLNTITKMACQKKPYETFTLADNEFQVIDFKNYRNDIGLLRTKISVSGMPIDWTKVRQLKVQKGNPSLYFKMDHRTDEWEELLQTTRRRCSSNSPNLVLRGPIKLSAGKYADLVSLCNGPTPVIKPSAAGFFRSLPHD